MNLDNQPSPRLGVTLQRLLDTLSSRDYILVRDTVAIYRSVIKYGGEKPRILTPLGRLIQRIIQALTGRHRED